MVPLQRKTLQRSNPILVSLRKRNHPRIGRALGQDGERASIESRPGDKGQENLESDGKTSANFGEI